MTVGELALQSSLTARVPRDAHGRGGGTGVAHLPRIRDETAPRMTRFQRLTLSTAAMTYLLVVVGAIVRSTGSGMGCPDWPTCHGALVPALGDTKAWLEWIHRAIAAVLGLLVVAVAVVAWLRYRRWRSVAWASLAAVVVTLIQAALGAITVNQNNSGDSVTAHLATAMILLGLLTFIAVRSSYPADLPVRGGSQRLTLLIAFATASVYALLLFGSHVTALDATMAFPDWPLFNGSLLPQYSTDQAAAAAQMAQVLHRGATLVVAAILLATGIVAWREGRARPIVRTLVEASLGLYVVQMLAGAAQIVTGEAPWAIALHVALGAGIWALMVAATSHSYEATRLAGSSPSAAAGPGPGGGAGAGGDSRADGPGATSPARPTTMAVAPADTAADLLERAPFTPAVAEPPPGRRWRDRVGAYVALTKPRIIELLLVTTVPAMVLATRDVPGISAGSWGLLVVATLVGGTLAAGSANAINCYLDRDIDEVMTRTRRRPLPAHSVDPEHALVFGLVLGAISFAWLLVTTNLLAAFLSLLAIAFYVVVYTIMLKRTTPQNIVIGGAAGALPPVIGWAAVTGSIAPSALFLFAIVFYWTPPHFWALAMRLSRDYAAAGVPMLPVVRGMRETARQIVLYTVLLVVLTLAFALVARMGVVYVAGALLLGALFLRQSWALWRDGSGEGAVRLYKFSITYLTALFALIALDVLVPIAL